jgi:hypothetical protein
MMLAGRMHFRFCFWRIRGLVPTILDRQGQADLSDNRLAVSVSRQQRN